MLAPAPKDKVPPRPQENFAFDVALVGGGSRPRIAGMRANPTRDRRHPQIMRLPSPFFVMDATCSLRAAPVASLAFPSARRIRAAARPPGCCACACAWTRGGAVSTPTRIRGRGGSTTLPVPARVKIRVGVGPRMWRPNQLPSLPPLPQRMALPTQCGDGLCYRQGIVMAGL